MTLNSESFDNNLSSINNSFLFGNEFIKNFEREINFVELSAENILNEEINHLTISQPHALECALDELALAECPNLEKTQDAVKTCIKQISDTKQHISNTKEKKKVLGSLYNSNLDKNIKLNNEPWDEKLDNMLYEVLKKNVLGESICALTNAYNPWLKKQTSITCPNLENYKKQARLYNEIVNLCESKDIENRTNKMKIIINELQQLGEPPEEVLHILFESTMSSNSKTSHDMTNKNIKKQNEKKNNNFLKQFDDMIKSNLNETNTDNLNEDDIKDDIAGFTKFIKELGFEGHGIEKLLDPELLMKAATGEITEEALADLIIKKNLIQEKQ